jgi:hypothetical protein
MEIHLYVEQVFGAGIEECPRTVGYIQPQNKYRLKTKKEGSELLDRLQ